MLRGDAGIGKSRLLAALIDEARTAGWRTAVGHGVGQAGSALAYLPFIELIGALAALDPDTVERVRRTHSSLSRLLGATAETSVDPAESSSRRGRPRNDSEPSRCLMISRRSRRRGRARRRLPRSPRAQRHQALA